jgi:hypothetical protein
MRRRLWNGAIVAINAAWLIAVSLQASGCSSGSEEMTCGADGCMVCDAYGCRPATPQQTDTPDGSAGDAGNATDGASGDSKSCDPNTTTCACAGTSECTSGLTCIDGLCLKACEYSSQCGSQRICVNGKCIVGCDATTACPSGQVCTSKGTCADDPQKPGCDSTNVCAGGMLCVQGQCHGTCTTNAGCATGEICDGPSGICIVDPQPSTPCKKDPSVCVGGAKCIDDYCRYPCTDSNQCTLIDARIPICSSGICKSETEAKPECTSQAQCPTGKDCVSNVCK